MNARTHGNSDGMMEEHSASVCLLGSLRDFCGKKAFCLVADCDTFLGRWKNSSSLRRDIVRVFIFTFAVFYDCDLFRSVNKFQLVEKQVVFLKFTCFTKYSKDSLHFSTEIHIFLSTFTLLG